MKKSILLIGIIVFVLLVQSFSFGAEQEKAITFEEKHKDKQAIFLVYDMYINVNEDWSYTTKMHKRLKILKEEARRLGEIPIPYDRGREKVTDVRACVITPDGKKHKYSKIQDFKVFKVYPMYSDATVRIITLPEVNVGSIIEYEATIITKGLPVKDAFWYMVDFDFSLPIKEMNFTIILPKKLSIQYKEFNLDYKPKITENGTTKKYLWYLQDIDDYKETEEYLPPPTPDNVRNFVEFSSIKNWDDIANWYYSLIQKNLKINQQIQEVAGKVLNNKVTTKDKVRAVLEYIQDNFRYVSMSFGDNALVPHTIDEIFQNKYGDCKDLSLLCMAMLKVAGIKTNMALFNNEFSINDPKYDLPIPSLFDHVLLLVEDPKEGDFYIDPLLDGYDIEQYPLNYQAAYTFIITENGGRFGRFPIFNEKRDYKKSVQDITIAEDGSALFEAEMTFDLDYSIKLRDQIKAMDKDEKERLFQRVAAYLAEGGEMLEQRLEGLDQKYGALKGYGKYRRKDAYPVTDGMMIIDLLDYDRDISFTEKERKNPIFCSTNSLYEDIIIYRIPKGFHISYIPKNINLDIGFFSVKREYARKQNEIIVTEVTRYKRLEIPKESYKKVKDFFDQLPAKTKQRIVLKKAKPWWQEIKDIIARFRRK